MMEIPKRLFLEITTECNLRCQLCKLWQFKDPPNRLNLMEKIQFLENLFDWLESNNQRKNFTNYIFRKTYSKILFLKLIKFVSLLNSDYKSYQKILSDL